MKNVSLQTMAAWLKSALEAECRIRVTEAALADLKSTIKTAGNHEYPEKPKRKSYSLKSGIKKLLIAACLLLAVLFGVWFAWFVPTSQYGISNIDYLIRMGWSKEPFVFIIDLITNFFTINITVATWLLIGFLCVIASVILAFYFLLQLIAVLTIPNENSKERRVYEGKYAEYKRRVAAIDRINESERKALPLLKEQHDALSETLKKLEDTRRKIYAKGYLNRDYCGLAPVAAMYGYIKTGRCIQVYGHGGVVDTFENDKHFAVLNGKLDTIISELESLRRTQHELVRALDQMRVETKALHKDIGRFAEQMHSDNERLIECTRWNGDTLGWISAVETSRLLSGK